MIILFLLLVANIFLTFPPIFLGMLLDELTNDKEYPASKNICFSIF